MRILKTITTRDGDSYTLAQITNSYFTITDSSGNIIELPGMTQDNANDVFNELFPEYHEN